MVENERATILYVFEILCDKNDSDSFAALAIRENDPIDVSSWSGVSTRIGNGSLPVVYLTI